MKRRSGGESSMLLARDCHDLPPVIDGELTPGEWPPAAVLPGNPSVSMRLRYDSKCLYLCWSGKGVDPIANDDNEFRRLFKTGACLDFQIGVKEDANPKRTVPVEGDQRLLFTFVEGKPLVVLYQPVAPGAKESEGWSTKTLAAGTTSFQRVVAVRFEARLNGLPELANPGRYPERTRPEIERDKTAPLCWKTSKRL